MSKLTGTNNSIELDLCTNCMQSSMTVDQVRFQTLNNTKTKKIYVTIIYYNVEVTKSS